MKKLFKRLVSVVAAFTIMSLSAISSFASEVETNDFEATNGECIELTITSEGITSAINANDGKVSLTSISGYGYACLRPNENAFIIYPDGDIGHVGFTIKTRCETWNGYTNCAIFDSNGKVYEEHLAVWSNGETYVDKTWALCPAYYMFAFNDIPEGSEMHVWIWIY